MSVPLLVLHADKVFALRVVAETASLRAAARRLDIAPSTLSEKLRSLEASLGVSLLRRGDGGRARLTAHGVELVRSSATALEPLRDLGDISQGPKLRTLRIGMYESISARVLPFVLRAGRRRLARTRLQVWTRRSAALVRLVAGGDLDLAVVVGHVMDTRVSETSLGHQFLQLYRPPKLTEEAAWEFARGNDWCGLAHGSDSAPGFYQRFCRKLGLGPLPRIVSDSFETLRATSTASMLPAVLPTMVGDNFYAGSRAKPPASAELIPMNIGAGARAESKHHVQLIARADLHGPWLESVVTWFRDALAQQGPAQDP